MNSFQAILVQTLAAACFAATPAVCQAAIDPAVAAPRAVAVTNAANVPAPIRRLEEEEVGNLLTAALNQRRSEDSEEWELRLTRPWAALTVPDDALTAQIVEPALNRISSNCILKFELRAGQPRHVRAVRGVDDHLGAHRLLTAAVRDDHARGLAGRIAGGPEASPKRAKAGSGAESKSGVAEDIHALGPSIGSYPRLQYDGLLVHLLGVGFRWPGAVPGELVERDLAGSSANTGRLGVCSIRTDGA